MPTAAANEVLAFYQSQPRYRAVAKLVASEIARGVVAPGDRLPGERDLCKHFDVSRVTVRKALGVLRDRGLIEADGTRGWFVTSTALGEPNALMSFSEMARSRGLTPTSRVRRAVVRPATIDEAADFGIAPGADLFDLERIRLLDGVAVAIECSRIPLCLRPISNRAPSTRRCGGWVFSRPALTMCYRRSRPNRSRRRPSILNQARRC